MAQLADVGTRNVLVLCQRKTGTLPSNKKVEDLIVPKIQDVVNTYIGPGATIEYLSEMTDRDGTVDYKLHLSSENPDAAVFIAEHTKFYSLIILNTCPLMRLDFGLISSLLRQDGLMYISAFPPIRPLDLAVEMKADHLVNQYFDKVAYDINLYRKKQQGDDGGLMIKRKRRKSYKQRKSYKRRKSYKI